MADFSGVGVADWEEGLVLGLEVGVLRRFTDGMTSLEDSLLFSTFILCNFYSLGLVFGYLSKRRQTSGFY